MSLIVKQSNIFYTPIWVIVKCGMAINAKCAKCDAPIENDMLTIDDGTQVQISKCPNEHGKIKSPLCCGQDMTCTV